MGPFGLFLTFSGKNTKYSLAEVLLSEKSTYALNGPKGSTRIAGPILGNSFRNLNDIVVQPLKS